MGHFLKSRVLNLGHPFLCYIFIVYENLSFEVGGVTFYPSLVICITNAAKQEKTLIPHQFSYVCILPEVGANHSAAWHQYPPARIVTGTDSYLAMGGPIR